MMEFADVIDVMVRTGGNGGLKSRGGEEADEDGSCLGLDWTLACVEMDGFVAIGSNPIYVYSTPVHSVQRTQPG